MEFKQQEYKYRIKKGDAFDLVKHLEPNSVALTITSPPYNIGKVYEKRTTLQKYLSPFNDFAKALYQATADNGSLCWEVGNYVEDGEVYPLDIYFYDIFKDAGFKLRNRVIWHFEHGLHASRRFSGRYETILWFTKADTYTFNLDSVRVPSKYPGKTHYKGEKRGQPSGNPLGKNPSDFWKIVEADWERLIWEIPNVKANHPEKTIHPCQFPIELVQRCILALTNEGDTVLDPFLGVGSTIIAALMHKRQGLGFELLDEYITLSEKRINDYRNGLLNIRPLGKPVYTPTGKEKVSQIPKEWVKGFDFENNPNV
jgi:adenine-specific DNA-methyltransferase